MPEPLKRILFIEADPDWVQMTLENLLENGFGPDDGYIVVHLTDILTGYQTIERDRDFIAVITAWKNPHAQAGFKGMRGTELLKQLRENHDPKLRRVPVVIQSVDPRAVGATEGAGLCAVVPKILAHELPLTLRTLLESAEA